MVHTAWNELSDHYPHIETDEFIAMPNHVHGIIVLNVGAQFIAPDQPVTTENQGVMKQGAMNCAPTKDKITVGEIVRAFKARCTHAVNRVRNTPGVPLWQRNYYERVIRNEDEMNAIREYIGYNPSKWALNEGYPDKYKVYADLVKSAAKKRGKNKPPTE